MTGATVLEAYLPQSSAPSCSAWCAVSNLLAVGGSQTADGHVVIVSVFDPSDPTACASLEVPLEGESVACFVALENIQGQGLSCMDPMHSVMPLVNMNTLHTMQYLI